MLINNAGIGSGRPDGTTRQESRDGHELRLAVNHLAGFLLTLRLLPLLRRSTPARVVHVASLGQAPMDFDDPMLERGYSGSRAYGQSKLAQITAGFELAERLDPAEVTVTSLHPSTYMPTKMVLEERGSAVDSARGGRRGDDAGSRSTPSSRASRAASTTARRSRSPTRRRPTPKRASACGRSRSS